MLFNSFEFLGFYTLVFVLFYVLSGKYRWVMLLIASYFFYMAWEPSYILLIMVSTTVDYFISNQITKPLKNKKRLLVTSLTINLGLLFFFKYFNFFSETVNSALSSIGIIYQPILSEVLLPVGISFYTFQTLSYTIDVYRGIIRPEKNFGKFALYVSFFPQLVAGPIERAKNLLPQILNERTKLTYDNFVIGFSQMLFGLFKKVVVADTLAIYVNSVYNNYELHSGSTLLLATYFFAFQIYCDFSGYSDIAIGVARMLGFRFMENFNMPYFSKSVTEFWRRWHISLSSWLRDYLYISLGGNRVGRFAIYRNLMITMLLGGLWHGASWNFVIWGGLNGIYLVFEKLLGIHNWRPRARLLSVTCGVITFNLIAITWVFFRSETLNQANYILHKIVGELGDLTLTLVNLNVLTNAIFGIIVLLLTELMILRKFSFENMVESKRSKTLVFLNSLMFVLIVSFGISDGSQFIYFQF